MLFNGKFVCFQLPMIFDGNLSLELWGGDVRTDICTDVRMYVRTDALRAMDCARWLLGYFGENFYLCYIAQTK